MNIHFTDESLCRDLCKASLVISAIGSTLYETADKFSDSDIIHIYAASNTERNSALFSHHQLQFKRNDVDYIFCSLHNFIRDALNGDSTVNFEVLNSTYLKDSSLEFLFDMRKKFYNYRVSRSYLGFARRDLKHINEGKNERDKNKKLFHVKRGLEFAKMITADYLNKTDMFKEPFVTKEMVSIYENYKTFDFKERKAEIDKLTVEVEFTRIYTNKLLETKTIPFYMTVDSQKELDQHLNNLLNSEFYSDIKLKDFDM